MRVDGATVGGTHDKLARRGPLHHGIVVKHLVHHADVATVDSIKEPVDHFVCGG
jgi:hypothetical protein